MFQCVPTPIICTRRSAWFPAHHIITNKRKTAVARLARVFHVIIRAIPATVHSTHSASPVPPTPPLTLMKVPATNTCPL